MTRASWFNLAPMLLCLLWGAFAITPAVAQSELEIQLEAEATEIDRQNDRLIFYDIRVSQGPLSIRANRAEGAGLEFNDSDWLFTGDVQIVDVATRIEAERATLRFVGHRLRRATLTGAPVSFAHEQSDDANGSVEQSDSERPTTVGRANEIVYDFDNQQLRLSGDAWLSEGTNKIASGSIVYDMAGQTVSANGNGDKDDRVHITITPPADMIESAREQELPVDEGQFD